MKIFLKKFWFLLFLIIPYCLIYYITINQTNYEAIMPGGLSKVGNIIKIDGQPQINDINSIYVYTKRNLTTFQKWFIDQTDIYSADEISSNYNHLTDDDFVKIGKIQKNQALECSLICAYNEAGKELSYSYLGIIVGYTTINEEELMAGDIITHIDDLEIIENYNYNKYDFAGRKITFIRDNKVINTTFTSSYTRQFNYYQKYAILIEESNPSFTVHQNKTLGPSGGLLQTIAIYYQLLNQQLDLKISGTGTISSTGQVGAIGGIKQKIITAYYNKIDIFFCPDENYQEALEAYHNLPVKGRFVLIKTTNFKEVIDYFEELI